MSSRDYFTTRNVDGAGNTTYAFERVNMNTLLTTATDVSNLIPNINSSISTITTNSNNLSSLVNSLITYSQSGSSGLTNLEASLKAL